MADQRRHRGSFLESSQAARHHTPVLLQPALDLLQVRPRRRFVDCTVGTGGHAEAILRYCLPGGALLGIDADPAALAIAKDRLCPYGESIVLSNDNFRNLEAICRKHGFYPVDGILFDLGLSSLQLDDKERGFSFRFDAPLDMRFSPDQPTTAAAMINSLTQEEIAALLREYGQERFSRLIARQIINNRPIKTTADLVNIIENIPGITRGWIHPATRTFQALRIAVNRELENLEEALKQTIRVLGSGGRLVVISYHSLEDRLVKHFMRRESKDCLCRTDAPVCTCAHTATIRLVNQKVITPSEAERRNNPRSRSAKLRAAERI